MEGYKTDTQYNKNNTKTHKNKAENKKTTKVLVF